MRRSQEEAEWGSEEMEERGGNLIRHCFDGCRLAGRVSLQQVGGHDNECAFHGRTALRARSILPTAAF